MLQNLLKLVNKTVKKTDLTNVTSENDTSIQSSDLNAFKGKTEGNGNAVFLSEGTEDEYMAELKAEQGWSGKLREWGLIK